MVANCGNCTFFNRLPDRNGHQTHGGFCQRYPPQVIPHQTGGGAYSPIRTDDRTSFPSVSHGDWCGEWKKEPVSAD